MSEPEANTSGMTCDDCDEPIRLEQTATNTLAVTCDCDKQRSIRVATVLPEGWSA